MRKLARLHNAFSQGLGAAQHVWEVMDEHAEINEKPNPIDLAPLQNEIEFREVRFGYGDESRAVLRGVSLTVPAGKLVALVGQSGGGKSTLTKLLPRFHDPTSGAVFWDGIDLRDARVVSLRIPCGITSPTGGRTPPTSNSTTQHGLLWRTISSLSCPMVTTP